MFFCSSQLSSINKSIEKILIVCLSLFGHRCCSRNVKSVRSANSADLRSTGRKKRPSYVNPMNVNIMLYTINPINVIYLILPAPVTRRKWWSIKYRVLSHDASAEKSLRVSLFCLMRRDARARVHTRCRYDVKQFDMLHRYNYWNRNRPLSATIVRSYARASLPFDMQLCIRIPFWIVILTREIWICRRRDVCILSNHTHLLASDNDFFFFF